MTPRLTAVPDAPKRAIALVRVSKVGDRGEDLTSPEIQRMRITDYAAARGYVVVEWVEALDESASRSRSPWWARLDAAIEQVEAGHVDVILVWRLSRAARNRRRWAVAIDRVDVAGGSLESATEQVDASTSTGRLARGMLAELAAWESDVKSEIWKETVARRHRDGLGHSSYPRLGYRVEGKGHVVDPETAPLLAELYRRYLAGDGGVQLASWLNGLGVRQPRSGGRWTPKTVFRTLDSGWAAGLLRVGDGYIEARHEAVVDERTWRAYRRARESRRGQPSRLVAPAHALSGLVRCPGCQHAMRLKRVRRRWVHGRKSDRPGTPMFVCEAFDCPARRSVSAGRATEAVLAWLATLTADREASAAVAAADRAARVVARSDRRSLLREAVRLQDRIDRLTLDLSAGLVLPDDYRRSRDALAEARREALAAADAAALVEDRPRPSSRRVQRLLDAWPGLDEVGRRRAVGEFVARVDVVPVEGGRALIRPLGVWEA